jgi:hypothetical protein
MEKLFFVAAQCRIGKVKFKDGYTLQLIKLGLYSGQTFQIAKEKAKAEFKKKHFQNPNHFTFYAIEAEPQPKQIKQ